MQLEKCKGHSEIRYQKKRVREMEKTVHLDK